MVIACFLRILQPEPNIHDILVEDYLDNFCAGEQIAIWPKHMLNGCLSSNIMHNHRDQRRYGDAEEFAAFLSSSPEDMVACFHTGKIGAPTTVPTYGPEILHCSLLIMQKSTRRTVLFEPMAVGQLQLLNIDDVITHPGYEISEIFRYVSSTWPRFVHIVRGWQTMRGSDNMECYPNAWRFLDQVRREGFPDTSQLRSVAVPDQVKLPPVAPREMGRNRRN